MTAIHAHGVTYINRAAATARAVELDHLNKSLGYSDGRVTELDALTEALSADAEATAAAAPKVDYAAREQQEWAERQARLLRQARAELSVTDRNTPQDGRIEYRENPGQPDEKRRIARYTTRDGFLRAYIRMASNPRQYSILFVDEN